MSKRRAAKDLNHDNWDQEDEKEDGGTFVPLKPTLLKDRVIKKAKRSLPTKTDGSPASSPFSQFAGFSTTSSPFSFLTNPSASKSAESNEGKNGVSTAESEPAKSAFPSAAPKSVSFPMFTSPVSNNQKTASTSESSSEFSLPPVPELPKASSNSEQTEPKRVIESPNGKPLRGKEYLKQLQSLNESVMKWMQVHLAKNKFADFTPVFKDYERHLNTLNLSYPLGKKHGNECVKSPETPLVASKNVFTASNNKSPLNESKPESSKKSNYGAHFKSNTTNTSTFSFGIKTTPTATSSASPKDPTSSSKEAEKEAEKPPSVFAPGFFGTGSSQLSDKPFTFTPSVPAANSESDKIDDEDAPPKNEFVPVTEEEALYSKRCKLFAKKGSEYSEKGIGTIYIKKLEDKTQLLMRADTNLGNILLNIMLTASLPMSRTGKNNVLLVCVPNPPLDPKFPDSQDAVPLLIRVKTEQDADELLEAMNKHKM